MEVKKIDYGERLCRSSESRKVQGSDRLVYCKTVGKSGEKEQIAPRKFANDIGGLCLWIKKHI